MKLSCKFKTFQLLKFPRKKGENLLSNDNLLNSK